MKYNFFVLIILCLSVSCSNQKLTHQEAVTQYYKARDATDFNEIKALLSDSITITEGDYIMSYTLEGFYEVFRWDSIFRPSYELVDLEEKNNQVIVSVALSSVRNKFLKNNAITCQYKISFNSGKLSKIESLRCLDVNWNIWQQERDSLVTWVDKNHPSLNGFIHDMTMNGAQNYLKAIELYETYKNGL